MDFSLKSVLDYFVNATPKPAFLIFVVSAGLACVFLLNPDLLPDWPEHVDDVAIWVAIFSGLLLLGFILWEGFDPVLYKVLRWMHRRKELKTLLKLTIDEVVLVSLCVQFRKKLLPLEKHDALAQSLENKGIIKRTFGSHLAEISTDQRQYYSPPEPATFEFVETIWQLIVNMDEFKVDAEALWDALVDGKRGDDLRAYLSSKTPHCLYHPVTSK